MSGSKRVTKKGKKTLISMPSESEEDIQLPQVSEAEEEEGEGREASRKRPRLDEPSRGPATVTATVTATVPPTPTATVTSASTLEPEGEEPPVTKKSSVADSLSAEKEQKLVDFFASNPIFYDQTLKEFKDKARRDHLLATIGNELGLTSKCKFIITEAVQFLQHCDGF